MIDKLLPIIQKYEQLRAQSMDQEIISDISKMISLNKEISALQESYDLAQEYKACSQQLDEAKEMLANESDSELLEMAKEEIKQAEKQLPDIEQRIKIALLPKDPNDDKNIFLEIRPAAGGDEAGLFGAELLKMYLGYATKQGRKPEIVEEQLSDVGGIKFVMVKIAGERVYSIMKFES
jgi:peptide chain release factor 1